MTLVPIVLLVLGFPIFVILLATSAIVDRHLLLDPADRAAPGDVRDARQLGAAGGAVLHLRRRDHGAGGISRRLVDWTKSLLGAHQGEPADHDGRRPAWCSGRSPGPPRRPWRRSAASPSSRWSMPATTVALRHRTAHGVRPDRQHDPAVDRDDPLCRRGRAVAGAHLHGRLRAGLAVCARLRGLRPGEIVGQRHRSAGAVPAGGASAARRSTRRGRSACRSSSWAASIPGCSRRPRPAASPASTPFWWRCLFYREVGLIRLLQLARRAAYVTSQIMMIVASAGVFSWLSHHQRRRPVDHRRLRRARSAALDAAAHHQRVSAARRLLHRSRRSAILLLTPILLPIVKAAGIDLDPFRHRHDRQSEHRMLHAAVRHQYFRGASGVQAAGLGHLSAASRRSSW